MGWGHGAERWGGVFVKNPEKDRANRREGGFCGGGRPPSLLGAGGFRSAFFAGI